MDKKLISEALGCIDEDYIIEALELSGGAYARGKENETMNGRKITKPARILLIAAALAMVMALGVGAYAADVFGFRALILGDPMENVVSLTKAQDVPETLDAAISEKLAASKAAWDEWSEYKTNRPFNMEKPEVYEYIPAGTYRMEVFENSEGGYSASYYDENDELIEEKAMSAEEYEALRAFDEVMIGNFDGYDFNYNVCSEEDADKLEEIAAKYGLVLKRDVNIAWSSETTGQSGENAYTNEELAELTSEKMGNSGNIFAKVPDGFDKAYWYDEGSFCVSFYVTLPSSGEQVTCYGYNSMYGTLYSGREVVAEANVDEFASREYVSADGTVLTILENGSEAYIYVFLEDSFYVQHIGTADMTVKDVNYIADYISYALIGK